MKLTKSNLQKIIKEELSKALDESGQDYYLPSARGAKMARKPEERWQHWLALPKEKRGTVGLFWADEIIKHSNPHNKPRFKHFMHRGLLARYLDERYGRKFMASLKHSPESGGRKGDLGSQTLQDRDVPSLEKLERWRKAKKNPAMGTGGYDDFGAEPGPRGHMDWEE